MGDKEATVRWTGKGLRFESVIPQTGVRFYQDSPVEGGAVGPSPMDLVLAAVGGCTAMDVVSILEKMREPVRGLEVRVSGERATDHPRIYRKVHVHYRVEGEGLDPEKVRKAIDLSQSKYCSVSAMVRASAELTYGWEIAEAAAGGLAGAGKEAHDGAAD
ncbi:MAG: OsmC family protein [Armatimonadota bacterium]|nr:OsmC family protein [Armatimonadota bacterium]MDR5697700.1 OsmC family protein [Armatimonadota bacterium]